MTNPARDLAATGTGPWLVCRTQYGPSIEDAKDGGQVFIESYGITYPADPADATKIVRAVNALPAIADLLDAIARLEAAANDEDGDRMAYAMFDIAAARDAVAAALTGETP